MSNEPKASMNLDSEMLAAYIDNRLTPEQRAEVEAELARDLDAHSVLVETLKALDAAPEAVNVPKVRTVPGVPRGKVPAVRRWAIAGGVLTAAAAVAVVLRLDPGLFPWSRGGYPDPLIARVVDAIGADRYVEGRLTGGFQHAPLRSTTRGTSTEGTRQLALRGVIDELRRNTTPAGRHALGLALLQIGDYDGAINVLDRAAKGTARAQSDLAAAFIARGKAYDRPSDYAQALAVSTRALEAEPNLLEARFNRALARQLMGSQDAPLAWKDYLSLDTDPSSPWAAEARAYLDSR